jgi:hypothetical protein
MAYAITIITLSTINIIVGLVANLAADALLGMDILGKSKTYVVTRSKSKQNEEIENEMVECEVHSAVH